MTEESLLFTTVFFEYGLDFTFTFARPFIRPESDGAVHRVTMVCSRVHDFTGATVDRFTPETARGVATLVVAGTVVRAQDTFVDVWNGYLGTE